MSAACFSVFVKLDWRQSLSNTCSTLIHVYNSSQYMYHVLADKVLANVQVSLESISTLLRTELLTFISWTVHTPDICQFPACRTLSLPLLDGSDYVLFIATLPPFQKAGVFPLSSRLGTVCLPVWAENVTCGSASEIAVNTLYVQSRLSCEYKRLKTVLVQKYLKKDTFGMDRSVDCQIMLIRRTAQFLISAHISRI